MSEQNKVPVDSKAISRKMGITIFVVICLVALIAAFFALRSGNHSKVHPTPSASPNVKPTHSASPPPNPDQSYVNSQTIEDAANVLALELTGRSWAISKANKLQRVNNLIASDLVSTMDEYVSSWDWDGCLSSKCSVFPVLYAISSKSLGSGQYLVTVTIAPLKNGKAPMPKKTFIFTVANNAGNWIVVALNTLAAPK